MSVSSVFRVFQSHPLFMSWERCKRWLTCSSKPQESHKMDFLYSFFVPFLDYISPIVTSLRQELSLFLLLYVVSWPLRQVRVKNSHFAEHLFVTKKYDDLISKQAYFGQKVNGHLQIASLPRTFCCDFCQANPSASSWYVSDD